MKAKIRGTNIEMEVRPFYDETGYFAGFTNGYNNYHSADIVFPGSPDWDKTDWSSFRREAAKDILAGMVAKKVYHAHPDDDDEDDLKAQQRAAKRAAFTAIVYVDALIEKLKQEPKKGL